MPHLNKPLSWIRINASDAAKHVVDLRCDFQQMSPIDAAKLTVQRITKEYPAPYTLMLSGGIDSQVMLYAWHLSGVPFQTRTVRYTGFNEHDLVQIEQFAATLSIDLTYYDFDLLDFLHNEYDSWAREYQCSSPQICTHMKMCSDIEGTVVFSGNYAERNYAFINFTTLGLARYAEKANKSIVPFFLMETPEMAFAFVPMLETFPNTLLGYERKVTAYQQAGFPIIRQLEKFTGFERVKDYYDEHFASQIKFSQKLKYARKASKRAFDLILRYPYEDIFGNPRYVFDTNWVNHSHYLRGSR